MEIPNISRQTFSAETNHRKERDPASFSFRSKKKPDFNKDIETALGSVLQGAIDEEKLLIEGIAPPPPLMPLQGNAPFPINAIQTVEIAPEFVEFFEKGIHAMSHMTIGGVSETTFFLDSPQFAGAKIVITEFNTAPKAFNISLIGAPEMVKCFQLHAPDLIAAFQKSPFNFSVHRLESHIDHHHLVHRKEDLTEENEEHR